MLKMNVFHCKKSAVKWPILSTLSLLLGSSGVFADEYLIRVDTIGYKDVPVSEKVPVEQLLHRIEVHASPNRAFCSEVRIGPETLTLEGVLKPEADGKFSAKIL